MMRILTILPAFCLLASLFLLSSALADDGSDMPTTGAQWYQQGIALQKQEKYDAALEAFQHAIDMKFQPAGALMRSAQISAALGDTDKAVEKLQAAADINPTVVSFLPSIGGIPALEGDPRLKAMLARADDARHPCRNRTESRQFDFWIGDWDVSNPQGQVVGTNHVRKDLEGCVLRESWTGAYGDKGTSVNFYDPATGRWHQVWTSENGIITHYVGQWRDNAMRFEASGFGDADGETHYRKMTFTPLDDGSVRQLIEDSSDGESWTTSFNGIYRKQM